MALRKNLGYRVYNITKISSSSSSPTPLSSPSIESNLPQNPFSTTFRRDFLNASGGSDIDQKDVGFFRRFLQKRAIVQSATTKSPNPSRLFGDKLMKKLKEMNMNGDRRLRLNGLYPPAILEMKPPEPPEQEEEKKEMMNNVSIEDAKKLLKVSQMEMLKSKLRQIPQNCISYNEFLEICVENSGSDQGLAFAKMLDDSGSVIVLGNLVFLRPEQVTKAIEGIIPLSIPQPNDAKQKELEKMEQEKMEIDKEAVALVRKELWAGLGFMVAQTAGLMRLTFWELSWDVMEPICFYITSIYFIAGYSFFLRTSKDPSFEGIFASRFTAKQKCLMKKKNFDLQKFYELRRACYPLGTHEPPLASIQSFEASDKTTVRAFGQ